MSDEALSPQEAKLKFQSQADMGMAQRMQEEEFSHLREGNVSTSQSRHQTVTVGSKVAAKVALQEQTLNKIVETERLKREEMDRKLATKLQDKNAQGQDQAGVQTWLSRELIGFEHTKNRIQERREGEQLAQQLQDADVAEQLQEREDREVAREMEEKEAGEEASLQMARALSRTDPDPATNQFSRTGSEGHNQAPSPGHPFFPAIDPRDRRMAKSKTFTNQVSSPNLRSPRTAVAATGPPAGPATAKRSHSSTQRLPAREGEGRNNFRMGRVPHEGHPFLQTPADQQMFREKEHALLTKTSSLRSPKRGKPPPYSQHSVPRKPKVPILPMAPATSVPHIPQAPVVPSSSSPVPPVPSSSSPVPPVPPSPVVPSSSSPVPPVPPSPVVPSSSSPVPPVPPSPVVPISSHVPPSPVIPTSSPVPPVPPSPVVPSSSPVPPVPPSPVVPSSSSPVPPIPPSPVVPTSSHVPASPVRSTPSPVPPSPVVSTPSPSSVPPVDPQTDTTDTTLETDQSADRENTPPPPPPFSGAAPTKFKHKFRK